MNDSGNDAWIITDAAGFIRDCSPASLQLLRYSARGVRGRELPNLFVTERPRLAELLEAARGGVIERKAALRPNDRRSVDVLFRIERLNEQPGNALLRWTFRVRWPVALRIPRGVDKRQVITIWRAGAFRCVFVPAGGNDRRLFVCTSDEVLLEEAPSDAASALVRAAELKRLVVAGQLRQ